MSKIIESKIISAIDSMLKSELKINPNSVAKLAGITTANLRHYPELHARIKLLKDRQKDENTKKDFEDIIKKQQKRIKYLEREVEKLNAKVQIGSDSEAIELMMVNLVEVYRAYDDICANAHDLVNLMKNKNKDKALKFDVNNGEVLRMIKYRDRN